MALIGPINGEISMAPIITAVELIFNPTDATTIAKTQIQRFVPLNFKPLSISAWIKSNDSTSESKLKYSVIFLKACAGVISFHNLVQI